MGLQGPTADDTAPAGGDTRLARRRRTYYVYDAAGSACARSPSWQNGSRKDERIYLGGFEIYREYDAMEPRRAGARDACTSWTTSSASRWWRRARRVTTATASNSFATSSATISAQPVLELDDQAQIISYEEYYPYGSTSYQAVRSQTEAARSGIAIRARSGMRRAGLYYHGARYYAPWLGRWVNCDPRGLEGWNKPYISMHATILYAFTIRMD